MRFAPLNVANLAIVLAAIGAVLGQLGGIEVDTRHTGGWSRDVSVPLLVAGIALAALACWVVFACVGYAVRWYGLSITREQGKEGPTLRRVHGLFTRRATTIEEAKVRGVVVRRPALIGLAGGAELSVLTTGLDDNQTGLLPAAGRELVLDVAADVLGERDAVVAPVTAHGPRARRRGHLRNLRRTLYLAAAIALVVVSAGLPWWVPAGFVAVALPLATWAAETRYRRLGHGLTERYLISCAGTFSATRTALEIDGIVGWRLHQSFWDRRLGLAQLTATTAAGREYVAIGDIGVDAAVAVVAAATPRMIRDFLTVSGHRPNQGQAETTAW
jgi:putative membrane protein